MQRKAIQQVTELNSKKKRKLNEMNEEQIVTVMQSAEFQESAMKIAGQLRISRQDAEAMLIEELWSHRHTLDTVGETLTGKQKAHINFGKKDILRSAYGAP